MLLKLLSAGADVNFDANVQGSALAAAAGGGHLEIMRILLAADAVPNAVSQNAVTPLINAVRNGQLGAVKLLLEDAGVDLDSNRQSALNEAAQHGHVAIADYLHASGEEE